MAEKKALQKELSGHDKGEFYSSSKRSTGVSGSKGSALRSTEGELESLVIDKLRSSLRAGGGEGAISLNLFSSLGETRTTPNFNNSKAVGKKRFCYSKNLLDTKLFLQSLRNTYKNYTMEEPQQSPSSTERSSGEFSQEFIVEVSSVLDKLKNKIAKSKSQAAVSISGAIDLSDEGEEVNPLVSLIDKLQNSLETVLNKDSSNHEKENTDQKESPISPITKNNNNSHEEDSDADDEGDSEDELDEEDEGDSGDEDYETETVQTVQTAILRKPEDEEGDDSLLMKTNSSVLLLSSCTSSDPNSPSAPIRGLNPKQDEEDDVEEEEEVEEDEVEEEDAEEYEEGSATSADSLPKIPNGKHSGSSSNSPSALMQRQPSRDEARSFLSSAIVKCKSREQMAKQQSEDVSDEDENDQQSQEHPQHVQEETREADTGREHEVVKKKDVKDLPWKIRVAKKRMELSQIRNEQANNSLIQEKLSDNQFSNYPFLTQNQKSFDALLNSKPRPYKPGAPLQSKSTGNVAGLAGIWLSSNQTELGNCNGYFNRPVTSKSSDALFKGGILIPHSLSMGNVSPNAPVPLTSIVHQSEDSDDSDEEGDVFSIKDVEEVVNKANLQKQLPGIYHNQNKPQIVKPYNLLQKVEKKEVLKKSELFKKVAENKEMAKKTLEKKMVPTKVRQFIGHTFQPASQASKIRLPGQVIGSVASLPVKRPTTLNLRSMVPDCRPLDAKREFHIEREVNSTAFSDQQNDAPPLPVKGEVPKAPPIPKRSISNFDSKFATPLTSCRSQDRGLNLIQSQETQPKPFSLSRSRSTPIVNKESVLRSASPILTNKNVNQQATVLEIQPLAKPLFTASNKPVRTYMVSKLQSKFETVPQERIEKPRNKVPWKASSKVKSSSDMPLPKSESININNDPSLMLFTPEQLVKIAVHKAAINKQLSVGEENRRNLGRTNSMGDNASTTVTKAPFRRFNSLATPDYPSRFESDKNDSSNHGQHAIQQFCNEDQICIQTNEDQPFPILGAANEHLSQNQVQQEHVFEQQKFEQQNLEQQQLEQKQLEQHRLQQLRIEQQQYLELQRIELQRLEHQKIEEQRLEHQIIHEQQLLEKQRLEQQRLEQQRLEQQRLEQQRLEQQRMEKQRIEQQRNEQQRLEQQRLEQQRLEQQRLEEQRLEQQLLEQQRLEQQRLEQQRMEKQRIEQQRIEQQQIEQQKMDQRRIEQQRIEQKRIENQKIEQQRIEKQRLEQQRLEQQRLEQQRIKEQRMEKQKIEKQLIEQQRIEKLRLEQQKIDQQRLEQQIIEQQLLDQQKIEQQRLEQQRLEEINAQKLQQKKLEIEMKQQHLINQEILKQEKRMLDQKIKFEPSNTEHKKLQQMFEQQPLNQPCDFSSIPPQPVTDRPSRPASKGIHKRQASIEGALGFVSAAVNRRQSREDLTRRSLSASGRTSSQGSVGYGSSSTDQEETTFYDDEVFSDGQTSHHFKPPQHHKLILTEGVPVPYTRTTLHSNTFSASLPEPFKRLPQSPELSRKVIRPVVHRTSSLVEKDRRKSSYVSGVQLEKDINPHSGSSTPPFIHQKFTPDSRNVVRVKSSSVSALSEQRVEESSPVTSPPLDRIAHSLKNLRTEVECQNKSKVVPHLPTASTLQQPQKQSQDNLINGFSNIPLNTKLKGNASSTPPLPTSFLPHQHASKFGSVPDNISKPKASDYYVPPLPTTNFDKINNKIIDRTKTLNSRAQSLSSLSSESSPVHLLQGSSITGGSSSYSMTRGSSSQVASQKTSYSSSSFSNSQSSNLRSQTTTKGLTNVSAFDKFKQVDTSSPKNSVSTTKPAVSGPLFQLSTSLNRSATGFKDILMTWCQCRTRGYQGVNIENFSTSWNDGLAFCALIHHFYPDAFDFTSLNPKNRRYNFALAFRIADERAGVMALLDVDDMVMMKKPDWKCVFTYVQSLYKRLKDE